MSAGSILKKQLTRKFEKLLGVKLQEVLDLVGYFYSKERTVQ
jgi:hypothetical protein